ncbi:MAG TPA: sigma-70 family RNA polymerase sigma factor [Vicinamibacterales bacterium]|nr:sigma-70 family RNA polymerase sigma factor [Vicinamibacterales bacterium]
MNDSSEDRAGDVTRLLVKWRHGDRAALDALIPLVYRELRGVAANRLRGERPGGSLQTTALVHETYLRLVDLKRLKVENRCHFFAVAARLMRQILVDQARRAQADKRGGGQTIVTLEVDSPASTPSIIDVLALDRALEELADMDERLCRIVELKFFGGLTIDEMADALDVSCATVERDWAVAKAWLYARMSPPLSER